MKTRLKQYLIVWLKFLVVTPGMIIAILFKTYCNVYLLFAAALLGDTKSYQDLFDDMVDDLGV